MVARRGTITPVPAPIQRNFDMLAADAVNASVDGLDFLEFAGVVARHQRSDAAGPCRISPLRGGRAACKERRAAAVATDLVAAVGKLRATRARSVKVARLAVRA
jgi:hypothetical protein